MKLRDLVRPALAAAALGLALLAAPLSVSPAQAFTFNNADGSSGSDGSSSGFTGYKDLGTQPSSRFGTDPADKYAPPQSGPSLRFGGQPESFDQRYNADRMFSPNFLSGR